MIHHPKKIITPKHNNEKKGQTTTNNKNISVFWNHSEVETSSEARRSSRMESLAVSGSKPGEKKDHQNGCFWWNPKHFQRIPFFAKSFFFGGGEECWFHFHGRKKKQLQKYVRLYYVWVLPWRKCRWKFGCPFAHAFAVHGSCTTPVWFQHPNKKSQGSTARFLRQPSLGSWCPFPTIPALKQEVSEAVDLC